MIRPGSIPSARATSRNSITSNRRSPLSNFETNDCGRPSFFASVTCVSRAFRRASAKRLRKCSCFRVNADFATGAVCYPNMEYPKLGYTAKGLWPNVAPTNVSNVRCAPGAGPPGDGRSAVLARSDIDADCALVRAQLCVLRSSRCKNFGSRCRELRTPCKPAMQTAPVRKCVPP
jgi:hypothetical protein